MINEINRLLQKQLDVYKSNLFKNCKNRKGIRKKTGDLLEHYYCQLIATHNTPITIEIGAHEATFSKNIKKSNPTTECYAYEANPYVYEKYKKQLKKFGINYTNIAICNNDDQISLEIPVSRSSKNIKKDSPIASIHIRDQPGFEYESIIVDSSKIESIFENAKESKALWIDVEGAQYEVLESIGNLWPTIDFIYIEIESRNVWCSDFNQADIYELIRKKGYSEIMQDNLASGQFNTVFAKSDIVNNAKSLTIVTDFTREIESLL